jgi:hypothetical protein
MTLVHCDRLRTIRTVQPSGPRLSAPQDRLTLELCLRILDSAALSDTLGQ